MTTKDAPEITVLPGVPVQPQGSITILVYPSGTVQVHTCGLSSLQAAQLVAEGLPRMMAAAVAEAVAVMAAPLPAGAPAPEDP